VPDTITFSDVIQWLGNHLAGVIVFLGFFVEITPIKINPISWIGKLLLKSTREEMTKMEERLNNNINSVKTELMVEINSLKNQQESEDRDVKELVKVLEYNEISRIRWEIIEFSNSINNNQKHTRDEFRHIKDDNAKYHNLIQKYNLENGYTDEEMQNINQHYEEYKDIDSMYI
jgi:hypothetical protein